MAFFAFSHREKGNFYRIKKIIKIFGIFGRRILHYYSKFSIIFNYIKTLKWCFSLSMELFMENQNSENDYNKKKTRERQTEKTEHKERDDLIIGRNAVREALKANRPAECLMIQKGERKGTLSPLIAQCAERKIPIKEADVKKLDFLCGHSHHQGVILIAAAKEYCTLEDIFLNAQQRGEEPFLILCDGLEDPHNLGAVIRSAEAAGAHGVVIPARRSTGLSYTVGKASAGALEYMPVARVTNLNAAIEEIKKRGVWIYAADMDGQPYYETDLSGAVAIVVGSEGKGVSRLVRENADTVVSIPMAGQINSLNASVAAGILMFEVSKTRRK